MAIHARRIDSYDASVYELVLAVFLLHGAMLILNVLFRDRIFFKLLIIFLLLILFMIIDSFVTNRSYNYLTRLRKRQLKKTTTGWPRAMDATTSTCPEVTPVYTTDNNIVLVKRKSFLFFAGWRQTVIPQGSRLRTRGSPLWGDALLQTCAEVGPKRWKKYCRRRPCFSLFFYGYDWWAASVTQLFNYAIHFTC